MTLLLKMKSKSKPQTSTTTTECNASQHTPKWSCTTSTTTTDKSYPTTPTNMFKHLHKERTYSNETMETLLSVSSSIDELDHHHHWKLCSSNNNSHEEDFVEGSVIIDCGGYDITTCDDDFSSYRTISNIIDHGNSPKPEQQIQNNCSCDGGKTGKKTSPIHPLVLRDSPQTDHHDDTPKTDHHPTDTIDATTTTLRENCRHLPNGMNLSSPSGCPTTCSKEFSSKKMVTFLDDNVRMRCNSLSSYQSCYDHQKQRHQKQRRFSSLIGFTPLITIDVNVDGKRLNSASFHQASDRVRQLPRELFFDDSSSNDDDDDNDDDDNADEFF